MKPSCLIAFVGLLTACASPEPAPEPAVAAVAPMESVAYTEGFDDGCHSGRQVAGEAFEQFRRDDSRFDTDRDYAMGWSDAFRLCESRIEAQQRRSRAEMAVDQINALEQERFDGILRPLSAAGRGELVVDRF